MDCLDAVTRSKEPSNTHCCSASNPTLPLIPDVPVWTSARVGASIQTAPQIEKPSCHHSKAAMHQTKEAPKDEACVLLDSPPCKRLPSDLDVGCDDSLGRTARRANRKRKWECSKAVLIAAVKSPPPAPNKDFKEDDDRPVEWLHVAKVLPFTHVAGQTKKLARDRANDFVLDVVKSRLHPHSTNANTNGEDNPKAGNPSARPSAYLFQLKVAQQWNSESLTTGAGSDMKTREMKKQVVLPKSTSILPAKS